MERELHEMDAVMGNGTAEGHGSPSPTYTRHQLAGFIDNVEFQRWLDRPATRPELLAEQVPLKRRPGRRRSRASTADDDVSSEDEQPLEPWGVLGRVRRTKAEAAAADHARAISAERCVESETPAFTVGDAPPPVRDVLPPVSCAVPTGALVPPIDDHSRQTDIDQTSLPPYSPRRAPHHITPLGAIASQEDANLEPVSFGEQSLLMASGWHDRSQTFSQTSSFAWQSSVTSPRQLPQPLSPRDFAIGCVHRATAAKRPTPCLHLQPLSRSPIGYPYVTRRTLGTPRVPTADCSTAVEDAHEEEDEDALPPSHLIFGPSRDPTLHRSGMNTRQAKWERPPANIPLKLKPTPPACPYDADSDAVLYRRKCLRLRLRLMTPSSFPE